MKKILFFLLASINSLMAYTNISPADVHARLSAGDSLLVVDVRELNEYQTGHLAEPNGMPILVPALLPLSSKVLEQEYSRLPQDLDLIIYCRSGGRSAAASAFLEEKGFTRIFNMTGGFSGWSYEYRTGGFGDGSGKYFQENAGQIICSENPDVSIDFSQNSFAAPVFVELHQIQAENASFPYFENEQLFQIIALDEFGIPIKYDQNLVLLNSVMFTVNNLLNPTELLQFNGANWNIVDTFLPGTGIHAFGILPEWLALKSNTTRVFTNTLPNQLDIVNAYPNPFNNSITIQAPQNAEISIYDALGRFITTIENGKWTPAQHNGSGIYIVLIHTEKQNYWQRIVYMK